MGGPVKSLLFAAPNAVQTYGDRGFRIAGVRYEGSVLIFLDRVVRWPITRLGEVMIDSFTPLRSEDVSFEIVILGCGRGVPAEAWTLRKKLREAGIIVEAMDTGAACRTFNVLVSEERRVAAALIAV